MNKNSKKKKKGFTLIELIIVLAIMAIIAAIAVPNFNAIRENSKTKADQQSVNTIKRNVLMLVTDETIKPDADKSKVGTFNKGGDNIADSGVDTDAAFTTDEKAKLKEAMAEVKAPNVSSTDNYTITVAKDGKVTVKTSSVTAN